MTIDFGSASACSRAVVSRAASAADDPYLDTTRLVHDTGFEPAFDVRAAVADYVAWLRDNPA